MKKRIPTLIASTCIALVMSATAVANRVMLANVSKHIKSLNLIYKLAYQDTNGHISYGASQYLQLSGNTTIPVDLKGHRRAGIVPVAINGHIFPDSATRFGKPNTCSAATDKAYPNARLAFDLVSISKPPHHRQITCSHSGNSHVA